MRRSERYQAKGCKGAESLQGGNRQMHCYFDVLERVLIDHEGVEVRDLDGAVAEAMRAVAELWQDPDSRAGLRSELFLLVRGDAEKFICVIPLNNQPPDH